MKDLHFWTISALRAADFGFRLTVKCFAGSGSVPAAAARDALFKYWHSRGIMLTLELSAEGEWRKKKIIQTVFNILLLRLKRQSIRLKIHKKKNCVKRLQD